MVCPELLSECLRDSPKFRTQLAEQESQIEQLETKVEKMLKLCHQMVDAGQTYVSHQSLFANAVWELAGCFKQEPDVTSALKRLVHALQEMNKYHTILLDQASRTIINNLTAFVKGDVQGVWDSQHHFNKISGELDMALNRHAQVSKAKPAELKEAQCLLEATTTCFRHNVLDHVHCVSMLQAKKKPEILGTFVSYLHACSTYFHQGSDLCEGLSPFLKQLNNEVGKLRDEASKLEKKLGNRHNLVAKNELADEDEPMQGYLFKRTSNAFKSWHRRWFCLRDHKLIYRKRSGEDETVMEEDLKLCSVKPLMDFDRRFCFEVMSPTRSHILQADSEEIFNKWVEALQEGIGAALQQGMEVNHNSETKDHNANGTPSSSGRNVRICEQLQKVPGNDVCCDCSTLKPTWASINLGVTLCIECSGIHRSLGVHNSKVRSLTLDSWEPEVLKVMLELGNSVVNKVYEANLPQSFQRLPQSALRSEREEFIKRKWIDREFVAGLVVRGGSPGSVNASRRRWSVRKLRRRGRSKDGKKSSLTPTASLDTTSDTMTISDDTSSIKTDNRASIVVVGDEESLPPSPGVDISSDEDSTSGAEETTSTVGEEMCKLNPTVLLYKASAAHNLPVMCRALALNADKQWTHPEQNNMGHLHQAIRSGSVMACEYLVLNGLSMNTQDDLGRTPLYLAVHLGHTSQVCLLLKHKADQHIKDIGGKDPLDIAVDTAHADIVTLLRLGRLNEEMKESETGDETFNDVVRDFSQMGNSPTKKSPSDSTTSDSKQPDKT